jgi:hypothetical protein
MSYLKRIIDASKGIQAQAKLVQIKPQDLPRLYANAVAEIKAQSGNNLYSDYENSSVKFSYQDDFEIQSKLGRGRYSEVFKASNLLTNEDVVVKILKPGKSVLFKNLSQTCKYKERSYGLRTTWWKSSNSKASRLSV